MKIEQKLLIGMAACIFLITILETGTIQLDPNEIRAQSEFFGMVLERNGEKAYIPVGDLVVATKKQDPGSHLSGKLIGLSTDGIIIQDPDDGKSIQIPVNKISSIYHGKYFKGAGQNIKEHMRWGTNLALTGGLAGALVGGIMGGACGGNVEEIFAFAVAGGVVGAAATGAVTLPASVLTGLAQATIEKGQAVKYVIGPDDWQILLE